MRISKSFVFSGIVDVPCPQLVNVYDVNSQATSQFDDNSMDVKER